MWATQVKPVPEEKGKSIYGELFETFTSSSTIHGTFFWGYSSGIVKAFWLFVVFCGISAAIYIIDNSFKAWESNPVITAVAQIPIEQVPFPSITICPLDSTSFGFVEDYLNAERDSEAVSSIPYQNVMMDSFQILRIESDLVSKSCLEVYCGSGTDDTCLQADAFKQFYIANESRDGYEKKLDDLALNFVGQTFAEFRYDPDLPRLKKSTSSVPPNCQSVAQDFFLLEDFKLKFPTSVTKKELFPGSLLRWVYTHSRGTTFQKREMYDKYLSKIQAGYSSSYGSPPSDSMTWPELVDIVAIKDELPHSKGEHLKGIKFSEKLFNAMRLSQHPPHLTDEMGFGGRTYSPTFPFCLYDKETVDNAGSISGPYGERYCDQFQPTFNENGMCYTFNNVDLGKFSATGRKNNISAEWFNIREVKGCGKSKGLRVVVDSHNIGHRPKGYSESRGFMVYVTVPGVVTHKVPFVTQPSFNGEYNLNIHGLHFIDASEEFRAWNLEKKACGFPTDKNLTYLSQFSKQDNCLLECKLKKISIKCGCSPWYLNQSELPVCGLTGGKCFLDGLSVYTDDLIDREVCDCKTDCEMTHFFTSMSSFPFSDRSATDVEQWFDVDSGSGILANYLIDPQEFFEDGITTRLTETLYNLNKTQLAEKRFRDDVTILNLFFDTPIITRITLKMRITIFDQISAFGGTMGLFTGISLVTFVEVTYWLLRFLTAGFLGNGSVADSKQNQFSTSGIPDPSRKVTVTGLGVQAFPVGSNGFQGYS